MPAVNTVKYSDGYNGISCSELFYVFPDLHWMQFAKIEKMLQPFPLTNIPIQYGPAEKFNRLST